MGFFSSIGKAIGKVVGGVGKVATGAVKTAVGLVKAPINLITGEKDPFKDVKDGFKTTIDGVKDIAIGGPMYAMSALGKTGGTILGGIAGFALGGPLGAAIGGFLGNRLGKMGREYEQSQDALYDNTLYNNYNYDARYPQVQNPWQQLAPAPIAPMAGPSIWDQFYQQSANPNLFARPATNSNVIYNNNIFINNYQNSYQPVRIGY